jgi:predicted MFS family arabinose efflux permease
MAEKKRPHCECKEDRRYDASCFLVESFAALEVSAVIVANARITESLGLREELSSYIITSYLYPLFVVLVLALLLSRWINRTCTPLPLFLTGLLIFAAGNVICFTALTPLAFFTGRVVMGAGAALSFVGQLWTLSVFHHHRITRPLVLGEVGAAIGDVTGPMLGGICAQVSPDGWRYFFLINVGVALITLYFAYYGLRRRSYAGGKREGAWEGAPPPEKDPSGKRVIRIMIAWQVAVSILIVGSEYFFSDQLQAKMGKSPLFVGGMTTLSAVGAILGGLAAVRLRHKLERFPPWSAAGMLVSLGALALCLYTRSFLLAGIPIFTSGVFLSLACVSIYAAIVNAATPDRFLRCSILYLVGMQIGNALGAQVVGVGEWLHLDVLSSALLLAGLPLVIAAGALIYSMRRSET